VSCETQDEESLLFPIFREGMFPSSVEEFASLDSCCQEFIRLLLLAEADPDEGFDGAGHGAVLRLTELL
jgi:hypothetical protein